MSEREHFLRRWSRRKQEAATAATEPSAAQQDSEQTPSAGDASSAASQTGEREPRFDPKDLPSIDSISAATDIRPFLTPGVPEELRRAALRRAWQADPAIRDFVGLSENSADFNDPKGLHGFGPLEMTEELKKIVERTLAPREHPSDVPSKAEEMEKPALAQAVELAQTEEPAPPKKQETGANTASLGSIPYEPKEKNLPPGSERDAHQGHVAPRREASDAPKSLRSSKVASGGALPK